MGRIRWFTGKDPNGFYRLVVSSPDGRWHADDLVGGITLATAKWEAKRKSDLVC